MSEGNLKFKVRGLSRGELAEAARDGWDWSRQGGKYSNHKNFFGVHWQVQTESVNRIRLHVQSPTRDKGAVLNRIKCELVGALRIAGIEQIANQHGYAYDDTQGRTTTDAMENNKSTEVFQVVLFQGTPSAATPKEKVKQVHVAIRQVDAVLGTAVDDVVQHFRPMVQDAGLAPDTTEHTVPW